MLEMGHIFGNYYKNTCLLPPHFGPGLGFKVFLFGFPAYPLGHVEHQPVDLPGKGEPTLVVVRDRGQTVAANVHSQGGYHTHYHGIIYGTRRLAVDGQSGLALPVDPLESDPYCRASGRTSISETTL